MGVQVIAACNLQYCDLVALSGSIVIIIMPTGSFCEIIIVATNCISTYHPSITTDVSSRLTITIGIFAATAATGSSSPLSPSLFTCWGRHHRHKRDLDFVMILMMTMMVIIIVTSAMGIMLPSTKVDISMIKSQVSHLPPSPSLPSPELNLQKHHRRQHDQQQKEQNSTAIITTIGTTGASAPLPRSPSCHQNHNGP